MIKKHNLRRLKVNMHQRSKLQYQKVLCIAKNAIQCVRKVRNKFDKTVSINFS
jgi:hypothetical protein